MKIINIYLDDTRPTPNNFIGCKTASECINLLKNNECNILSLDHDLGEIDETGYDVLLWLEEKVLLDNFYPPKEIRIHSDNCAAWKKMQQAITFIYNNANSKL